ncbi:MAG: RodZ domain-containing protein [Aliidongia sp.]
MRIKAEYLDALERNTVDGLPGPTYATGFLRAYSEYLAGRARDRAPVPGAEKTGLHTKPELAFPVPLTDRGIPGGGIFLIAVLVAALCYGGYYYYTSGGQGTRVAVEPVRPACCRRPRPRRRSPSPRHPSRPTRALPRRRPRQARTTAAPPAAGQLAGTAPVAPERRPYRGHTGTDNRRHGCAAPPERRRAEPNRPTAGPADADAAPPKHYGDAAPGRIVLRATGKAWVTVKDGGKPIVNTLFNKGDVYNVPDRAGLILRTGSAGSLDVMVDGRPCPRSVRSARSGPCRSTPTNWAPRAVAGLTAR